MITCGAVNLRLFCGNCRSVLSEEFGVQNCHRASCGFSLIQGIEFAAKSMPTVFLRTHSWVHSSNSWPQFFLPHSSLPFVLLKMLADMLRWKAPLVLILLHLCLVNNYACDHDEASIHFVNLFLSPLTHAGE